MVAKYPDAFPRQTAWNKIPQSVHEAYNKEYWEVFPPDPLPLLPDGSEPRGIKQMGDAMWHQAELRAQERASKPEPTFAELMNNFHKAIEQGHRVEDQKKALWNKHYKKYGVEYRKENKY
jgi:hypothetical protein